MNIDIIKNFKQDLIEVYRKHGLSLSHQDRYGSFLVEDLTDYNINLLLSAYREASNATI